MAVLPTLKTQDERALWLEDEHVKLQSLEDSPGHSLHLIVGRLAGFSGHSKVCEFMEEVMQMGIKGGA